MSAGQPGQLATLRGWLVAQDWIHLSLVYTLLDAHLIFEERAVPAEAVGPLFQRWWPGVSLAGALDDCCRYGLLSAGPDGCLAVPADLRGALSQELERHLGELPVQLPGETLCLDELLDDFAEYQVYEPASAAPTDRPVAAGWPGRKFASAGRWHLVLPRPFPLCLKAHPDAFIVMLCRLPEDGWPAIAAGFVASPALRARVAIYDLAAGHKANLTRSEPAVYFERYLQREWGVRLTPAPAFSQGLIDGGLLSLRQG